MGKNSELFEVIANWQLTKLPVTLASFEGVYPSMRYPGATGAPFVRVAVQVDGQIVDESTVPGTGTAHEWLKQVASTMGLPEPTEGGWRDPLSVTNAYASWYEAREREAQLGLLEKGVDPVVVLRATQYLRDVGRAIINRLNQHQVDALLRSGLAADEAQWYGRLLGKRAVELGNNSTWVTNERYLYRSRYPEVREGAMAGASKVQAVYALNDPETEVARAATIRLAELGEQATVDAVALDESRSAWERFPAIARATPSVLEPLLHHVDAQIRTAALGRIGKPAFAALLNDPDENVAYSLEQALIQAPAGEANGMLVSLAMRQPVDRAAHAAAEALRGRGLSVKTIEEWLPYGKQPIVKGYKVS